MSSRINDFMNGINPGGFRESTQRFMFNIEKLAQKYGAREDNSLVIDFKSGKVFAEEDVEDKFIDEKIEKLQRLTRSFGNAVVAVVDPSVRDAETDNEKWTSAERRNMERRKELNQMFERERQKSKPCWTVAIPELPKKKSLERVGGLRGAQKITERVTVDEIQLRGATQAQIDEYRRNGYHIVLPGESNEAIGRSEPVQRILGGNQGNQFIGSPRSIAALMNDSIDVPNLAIKSAPSPLLTAPIKEDDPFESVSLDDVLGNNDKERVNNEEKSKNEMDKENYQKKVVGEKQNSIRRSHQVQSTPSRPEWDESVSLDESLGNNIDDPMNRTSRSRSRRSTTRDSVQMGRVREEKEVEGESSSVVNMTTPLVQSTSNRRKSAAPKNIPVNQQLVLSKSAPRCHSLKRSTSFPDSPAHNTRSRSVGRDVSPSTSQSRTGEVLAITLPGFESSPCFNTRSKTLASRRGTQLALPWHDTVSSNQVKEKRTPAAKSPKTTQRPRSQTTVVSSVSRTTTTTTPRKRNSTSTVSVRNGEKDTQTLVVNTQEVQSGSRSRSKTTVDPSPSVSCCSTPRMRRSASALKYSPDVKTQPVRSRSRTTKTTPTVATKSTGSRTTTPRTRSMTSVVKCTPDVTTQTVQSASRSGGKSTVVSTVPRSATPRKRASTSVVRCTSDIKTQKVQSGSRNKTTVVSSGSGTPQTRASTSAVKHTPDVTKQENSTPLSIVSSNISYSSRSRRSASRDNCTNTPTPSVQSQKVQIRPRSQTTVSSSMTRTRTATPRKRRSQDENDRETPVRAPKERKTDTVNSGSQKAENGTVTVVKNESRVRSTTTTTGSAKRSMRKISDEEVSSYSSLSLKIPFVSALSLPSTISRPSFPTCAKENNGRNKKGDSKEMLIKEEKPDIEMKSVKRTNKKTSRASIDNMCRARTPSPSPSADDVVCSVSPWVSRQNTDEPPPTVSSPGGWVSDSARRTSTGEYEPVQGVNFDRFMRQQYSKVKKEVQMSKAGYHF